MAALFSRKAAVATAWRRELGSLAPDLPLVGKGERIFAVGAPATRWTPVGIMGPSVDSVDQRAFALDVDTGQTVWEAWAGGLIQGRPAPLEDGGLVVLTRPPGAPAGPYAPHRMAALDARDGHILWEREVKPGSSLPVVAGDAVVVRDGDFALQAFDAKTGSDRWRARLNFVQGMQPAAGRDGTVYVYDHPQIKAFRASDGQPLWKSTVQWGPSHLVWREDGRLLASAGDVATCLDAHDGHLMWSHVIPQVRYGDCPVGPIVAQRSDWGQPGSRKVTCLEPTGGSQRWSFTLTDRASEPTSGRFGDVFFALGDDLVWLNGEGMVRALQPGVYALPLAAEDGGVFLADPHGTMTHLQVRSVASPPTSEDGAGPGRVVPGPEQVIIDGVAIPVRPRQ